MAVIRKNKPVKAKRLVKLTPKKLAALIGENTEIGVSAVQLKEILGAKAVDQL